MNKYNTFWQRLAAGLIDDFVLYPIIFLSGYVIDTESNLLYTIGLLLSTILYSGYFVWCHGRYGQTIGKKSMGIRVLDINESQIIGIKRALIRESPLVLISVIAILFFSFKITTGTNDEVSLEARNNLENLVSIFSFLWVAIELITMLTNSKRRALHDFLANSVVVKESAPL